MTAPPSVYEVVAASASLRPDTDFVLVIRWWAPTGSEWRPFRRPDGTRPSRKEPDRG
jgi:hypothetical protein